MVFVIDSFIFMRVTEFKIFFAYVLRLFSDFILPLWIFEYFPEEIRPISKYCDILVAGMWIHIHLLRIRIQQFFSMLVRIQLKKLHKKLSIEDFSLVEKA